MHQTVFNVWPEFSRAFEGYVHWMYLDVKKLVTIGIGNLIDPLSLALTLPFVRKTDGIIASQREITFEWRKIKTMPELAEKGHEAAKAHTLLMLTDTAIATLVNRQLLANENILKSRFPEIEEWPADAQLGLFSMAWAMGPAFTKKWPNFSKACEQRDWRAASRNCKMNETKNKGLIPRNKMNKLLFATAADVEEKHLELPIVYGLGQVKTGSGIHLKPPKQESA